MQATLEDALSRVTQEEIHVIGSGRTDAGAHAAFQIVAFATDSMLPAATLQRAANALLPRDVAITGAREVAHHFHPRFDAESRVYRYVIWNRPVRSPFWEGRGAHVKPPLDVDRMHRALQYIVGRRDFGSFVPTNFSGSRERTVFRATCVRVGWSVHVEIEAEGFMRQMVRSIVGTLIDVGRGKIEVGEFDRILQARDRTRARRTAPAAGLYLSSVQYSDQSLSMKAPSVVDELLPASIGLTPEEK